MQDYEKLGFFYLGKELDLSTGSTTENLLLYDAKDLTTHAMMVGMTGSGKTGLAMALLEEAAIDGVPSLLIDPKGDLGNFLLQFPDLLPEDFRPWVEESDASRKGLSPDEYAAKTAETWRQGLAQWGQDPSRIRRLKEAAEVSVYTPGSTAGRPLQILRSFDAPPPAIAQDPAALRERIVCAVSGLLGLLGIEADPVQSRDHILLSNLLDRAWREGRGLDIAGLIQEVQKPPFEKVGIFDVEAFYPAKERFGLAMRLNNLIASPGFSAWLEGDPIDVRNLLYTPGGKPRVSVRYLAHLTDAERMFFVTILLNEVIAWMRTLPGTGSLRALLYMDEIFGYFPPSANPPSKLPMLTLLKQARAFGLGVVLSTQNPVDLDYKGLSNCGTWFIGRLQTDRDKMRVIEGLEGAASRDGSAFDRAQTERLIAGLGNRVFLMRNVHEDAPAVFQTRWALSYLRGPMTLPQIAALARSSAPAATSASVRASAALSAAASDAVPSAPAAQACPPDVPTLFLRPKSSAGTFIYKPHIFGFSKLHFVDAKASLDVWRSFTHLAPLSDSGREALWEDAIQRGNILDPLDPAPQSSSQFAELKAGASNPKSYPEWRKTLEASLYQNLTLDLFSCPALKLTANADESEGDFSIRAAQALREKRDQDVARLKEKYAPKLQALTDQLRRANERVEREKSQAGQQKWNTALSVGATLLGALMGRGIAKVGNVGRAATAMKNAGRIGKEAADVERATEGAEVLQARLSALQAQFEAEVTTLQGEVSSAQLDTQKRQIRPRKSDISAGAVGLCWVPYRQCADGTCEPA